MLIVDELERVLMMQYEQSVIRRSHLMVVLMKEIHFREFEYYSMGNDHLSSFLVLL